MAIKDDLGNGVRIMDDGRVSTPESRQEAMRRLCLSTSQQAAMNERKEAEHEYTISAFDYVSNPVGSRDWCLFYQGWQASLKHAQQAVEPFQQRVQPWMVECFGPEIAADTQERNHRFLEESLELVQACGATQSEAHQLVDYVYGRPVGDKHQEVGGVMVTLAALCLAQGLDMHQAGETELARIWTKVEKIRAKQAAKPKHSPLPMSVESEREKVLEEVAQALLDAGYNNAYEVVYKLKSQQPAQAGKDKP